MAVELEEQQSPKPSSISATEIPLTATTPTHYLSKTMFLYLIIFLCAAGKSKETVLLGWVKTVKRCCCCIGFYLYGGWKMGNSLCGKEYYYYIIEGMMNEWGRRGWREGNEFPTWLLVCRLVRPPRWAFFKINPKDGRHNPSHLSLSYFKAPFFVPISYIPRTLFCPMSSVADVDGLRLSILSTLTVHHSSLFIFYFILSPHFFIYLISSLTIYNYQIKLLHHINFKF